LAELFLRAAQKTISGPGNTGNPYMELIRLKNPYRTLIQLGAPYLAGKAVPVVYPIGTAVAPAAVGRRGRAADDAEAA
jgi:hypothetical protein